VTIRANVVIALGGTIGTGLFVGIGKALYASGPLSILLGYSIMGFFIYAMMQSLVCLFLSMQ
jgi:amino acid transporter